MQLESTPPSSAVDKRCAFNTCAGRGMWTPAIRQVVHGDKYIETKLEPMRLCKTCFHEKRSNVEEHLHLLNIVACVTESGIVPSRSDVTFVWEYDLEA